jgi:predicted transcriptional regulator
MTNGPVKNLSDAVFGPVNTAYQVGGLALAFLSLGAFVMLAAFFLPGNDNVRYVVVFTGLGLIAMVGTFFYSRQLSPLFKVRKSIRENSELIDAVQATAIELTQLTSDLQKLAFLHAEEVAEALEKIRPVVKQVPFLGAIAESKLMSQADRFAGTITEYSDRTERIVSDLRKAITESNPSLLKTYLSDLQQFRLRVHESLKTPNLGGRHLKSNTTALDEKK